MEWKRPRTGIRSDKETVTDLSTRGALGVKVTEMPPGNRFGTRILLEYCFDSQGISGIVVLGVAGEDVALYMPFELYRTIDFEETVSFHMLTSISKICCTFALTLHVSC
jgi:hypothetical protein